MIIGQVHAFWISHAYTGCMSACLPASVNPVRVPGTFRRQKIGRRDSASIRVKMAASCFLTAVRMVGQELTKDKDRLDRSFR